MDKLSKKAPYRFLSRLRLLLVRIDVVSGMILFLPARSYVSEC